MSTRKNQVLGPAFFKRLAVSKGSAFGRPTQRAKSPNDTKRSGRAAKTSRWDVLAKGNPIKGFPAGRSPAPNAQTITAPARRNGKRFDSLARFFALENGKLRHAAISLKLRLRGHPRAACGPPFPCFGLRPRRNGGGVSPSAEGDQRRCLWNLPAF